jgi:hypothetical protein
MKIKGIHPMADIIDEIGDDLRQQKLMQFWNDNGRFILLGAALAVALTAALHFWRVQSEKNDLAQTAVMVRALEQTDAGVLLQLAGETDPAHGFLVRLAAARAALDAGKKSDAVEIYRSIGAEKALRPVYRDLGILLATSVQLGDKNIAPAELEKLVQALVPLSEKKSAEKSPWRHSALEITALIKARLNNKKEAMADLSAIIEDTSAPQDLRQRALRLHDDFATHL